MNDPQEDSSEDVGELEPQNEAVELTDGELDDVAGGGGGYGGGIEY